MFKECSMQQKCIDPLLHLNSINVCFSYSCCHGDGFSVNTVDHGLMGDWKLGGHGTVGRLRVGC